MNEATLVEAFVTRRGYLHQAPYYLDSNQQLVRVEFVREKLDMAYFKQIQKQISEDTAKCSHIVFIYYATTLYAKNLRNFQNVLQIEMFEAYELQRLLTGNRFTPAYTVLSPEEIQQVLSKYTPDQLPSILVTDPIAKLHNCQVGQIIQIDRGLSMTYRIVV